MTGLSNLETTIRQDPQKAIAGAAAAAAVIAFALFHKKKAATTAATAGGAGVQDLAGYTAGLSGTPNTSGTDQGNYFQDQLNALQQQINGPAAGVNDPTKISSPRYVRFADAASPGSIYQVENGQILHLTPAAYKALGSPAPEMLTTLDPLWTYVSNYLKATPAATAAGTPAPAPAHLPPRTMPHPTAPGGIKTPAPAPPGRTNPHLPTRAAAHPTGSVSTFTIGQGGSLYEAAQHFYGPQAPSRLQALAAGNGIKLSVRGGQTYATVYPGQTIKKV